MKIDIQSIHRAKISQKILLVLLSNIMIIIGAYTLSINPLLEQQKQLKFRIIHRKKQNLAPSKPPTQKIARPRIPAPPAALISSRLMQLIQNKKLLIISYFPQKNSEGRQVSFSLLGHYHDLVTLLNKVRKLPWNLGIDSLTINPQKHRVMMQVTLGATQ